MKPTKLLKFMIIFIRCILTIFALCLYLPALPAGQFQDAKNDLRILELLPNLACPLAVEPSIPDDFIALSPSGNIDPYDWIYWGPKEVLSAYFKNPDSLKVPILRVKLSANVAQTGPNSFNNEEGLKMMKKEASKEFSYTESKWGDYPVFAVRTKLEDQLVFTTWVGLNDPEGGWTLMFNLVYPHKKGPPNEEARQLWESLIMKTSQLKDGDYFKAYGQDLQEGYTIVNICGSKLKMVAEKRQSDGTLQVMIIPEDPNVEFHYEDMIEGAMGAKWKFGEPLVKVYGEILINNNIINYSTSIFFKSVPEFSFKKEDGKQLLIFQKNCEKKALS